MWFFRLIRWPNLLITIFTQLLLYFAVTEPFIVSSGSTCLPDPLNLLLLVFSTVLIAAAGYIINDFYDLHIDRINKPDRIIMGKNLTSRNGLLIYYVFNAAAIIAGFLLAWRIGSFRLGFIFPLVAGLLWSYSIKYKCTPISGNLLVAFLSALVVLIVWLFVYFELSNRECAEAIFSKPIATVVWFYAAFAFLVSLVREILKDIEDTEGDKTCECRTFPAVVGTASAKFLAVVLIIITILVLAIGQILLFRFGFTVVLWYYCIPQFLLAYLLVQTIQARQNAEFGFPANVAKLIMVAGILGMQLFRL